MRATRFKRFGIIDLASIRAHSEMQSKEDELVFRSMERACFPEGCIFTWHDERVGDMEGTKIRA